jgi:LysM repeat protein
MQVMGYGEERERSDGFGGFDDVMWDVPGSKSNSRGEWIQERVGRSAVMKHWGNSNVLGLTLVGLALIFCCTSCATTTTTSDTTTTATKEIPKRWDADEEYVPKHASPHQPATIAKPTYQVPYFPPPANLDLCGEPVPLHNQEVLERFDKEFTVIVYNHAQVFLWLKRMERYFPWIEERLRYHNLPDDLKYVAVAESDLLPNAVSPKGAGGPWQFMPATGRAYGLSQKGSYDERYDHERSTDSAFLYLKNLHSRFNNWALAIAAYNCGEGRIQDQMRSQGVSDYYNLKLPLETERYVLRILAIKAVLSNPAQYGYAFSKGQGYPEFQVDRVNASFPDAIPIRAVAAAAGTTFREFKRLNPTFRADEIPAGAYEIKLPAGCGEGFKTNFESVCRAPQPAFSADASEDGADNSARTLSSLSSQPQRSAPGGAQSQPSSQESSKELAQKAKPTEKKSASDKSQSKTASVNQHLVKKGDTLSSIARQYSVSADELRKTNKINGSTIKPGQKLVIP